MRKCDLTEGQYEYGVTLTDGSGKSKFIGNLSSVTERLEREGIHTIFPTLYGIIKLEHDIPVENQTDEVKNQIRQIRDSVALANRTPKKAPNEESVSAHDAATPLLILPHRFRERDAPATPSWKKRAILAGAALGAASVNTVGRGYLTFAGMRQTAAVTWDNFNATTDAIPTNPDYRFNPINLDLATTSPISFISTASLFYFACRAAGATQRGALYTLGFMMGTLGLDLLLTSLLNYFLSRREENVAEYQAYLQKNESMPANNPYTYIGDYPRSLFAQVLIDGGLTAIAALTTIVLGYQLAKCIYGRDDYQELTDGFGSTALAKPNIG